MNTASSPSLPIIHFPDLNLKPGTLEWDSVKLQIWNAIEEYGCFQAVLDNFPGLLHKEILNEVEELFHLPLSTKKRAVSEKPFYNYLGQSPRAPLFEALSIDHPIDSQNIENFSSVFWPEGKPNFCNVARSFSKQVTDLEKNVRTMIVESLGLEKYLEEHMNASNYILKLIKYQSPQTTETKLGLVSHTDKNIITVLYQNHVDGLEVQTKDGEWIKVKFSPGSFIVFIGESLNAWVNGRLHSANHGVNVTGNEARYSIGLFSIFKPGYTIKTPEELVDEEHPQLYKPFDYFEFLEVFQSPEGRRPGYALKDYCGV